MKINQAYPVLVLNKPTNVNHMLALEEMSGEDH